MQRTSTRRLLRRGYKSARTSATYGTGGSTGAAERFPCPVRNSRAQRYGSRPRPSGCDGGRGRGNIALHLDRTDLAASGLSGKIRIDSDRGNIEAVRLHGSLHVDVDRGNAAMRDVRIAGDSRVAVDRGDLDLELASQHAVTVHADVSRRARVTSELSGATRHSARRWSMNGGGPELKIAADRGHVRLRSN